MNEIKEDPWLVGPSTKVWQARWEVKRSPAALGVWLIYAPWMHLAWQYHAATVVHLRPLDGIPAHFQFPGATHEFQVVALAPDYAPTTLVADQFVPLDPPSIIQQYICTSDATALETITTLLPHIAAGRLSVDSDFRQVWQQLLRNVD